MKILWFNWKDMKNPAAGGAEVVNEELAKRLVQNGHEVVFVTAGFDGASAEETRDGFRVIRVGGRWSVYWHAYKYYKKNLVGWADLVIDEVNTIPFFAKFYVKERNILFIHQLAREIWFYQMFFPLNVIGYILEPLYLRLLKNKPVITVSESTRADLVKCGFERDNISIISEGITIPPTPSTPSPTPSPSPTSPPTPSPSQERGLSMDRASNSPFPWLGEGVGVVLSLGAFREMKRTDHIVKAFEIAREKNSNLKLVMAGDTSGKFGDKVIKLINNSKYKDDITVLGRVSEEQKIELMREACLIAVTSVKEGWGLIVTEANSQGTSAVVYNVDGLRDSVRDGVTGIVAKENTPDGFATAMLELLSDEKRYEEMRKRAWEWSKEITFERSYEDFVDIIRMPRIESECSE